MSNLNQSGAYASVFKIGQLGTTFNPKLDMAIGTVLNILSRPIDGHNIVTTCPTDDMQVYGWGSPIPMHKDGTGYIFFMPMRIDGSPDYIIANGTKIKLEVGGVYGLDDAVNHATEGDGYVVAAFYGSYQSDEILRPGFMENMLQQFRENCF